ncbi:hypothetical protein [Mastigocoleus sp. MO_188.B34]|uniref:hypothetical protein n=1 Tax=Mastigocoleus sp. MO_188.B34 TaxID=3036635 RepID=UPI0026323322|nr:hypothetical protein [Mastigocoleus sp. MO_188.B34]MDJ0696849.1 hypothetical protein [Mastigocoleus sp. MO_188.B34]
MVFSKKSVQIAAKQEKELFVTQQNILPREEDKKRITIILVANTKSQGKEKKSH